MRADVTVRICMVLCASLSMCALADNRETSPSDWQTITVKLKMNELNAERIEKLRIQCEAGRLGNDDILKMFDLVLVRGRTKMDVCLMLEKVEEGLTKGVPVNLISVAIKGRQRALVTARRMLSHSSLDADAVDELLASAVYALESGITSLLLAEIIQRSEENGTENVRACIETSEFLQLAGVDEPEIRRLVLSGVKRELSVPELRNMAHSASELTNNAVR